MKKQYILFILLTLVTATMQAQSGQKWSLSGNSAGTGDFLGTSNAVPLHFRTNNQLRFSISPLGSFTFHSLADTSKGIMILNNSGDASRLNFTGNTQQVLAGNGTWVSSATMNNSGWNLQNGVTSTFHPVSINGALVPNYALNVGGNVFASGKISATAIEVVQLVYADTIKGAKQFRLSESLRFKGRDINDPNSRNDICGMGAPLFIQSNSNSSNTVFNYGNNANVGIGTNNPQYKLDVLGDVHISGLSIQENIKTSRIKSVDSLIHFGDSTLILNTYTNTFYPSTNGSFKGSGFGHQALPRGLNSVALGNRTGTNSLAENAITIGSGSSSSILYNTISNSLFVGFNSNIPTLFVGSSNGNNTTGNVGIGTTNPGAKLQIGEGIEKLAMGSAYFSDLGYGTSYTGFNLNRNAGGWQTSSDGNQNGGSLIYGTILGNLHFVSVPSTSTANPQTGISDVALLQNTRMIIHNDGRIGIGTQCVPVDHKLAVDGKVICEEVTVKLSDNQGCWPDYVFAKNYSLLPLSELEQFILKFGHLPNMPSAPVVEEEGLELKTIIIKQQEKIEELTLYLLELNKRIAELEKK